MLCYLSGVLMVVATHLIPAPVSVSTAIDPSIFWYYVYPYLLVLVLNFLKVKATGTIVYTDNLHVQVNHYRFQLFIYSPGESEVTLRSSNQAQLPPATVYHFMVEFFPWSTCQLLVRYRHWQPKLPCCYNYRYKIRYQFL